MYFWWVIFLLLFVSATKRYKSGSSDTDTCNCVYLGPLFEPQRQDPTDDRVEGA